jgi:hypothetical protein
VVNCLDKAIVGNTKNTSLDAKSLTAGDPMLMDLEKSNGAGSSQLRPQSASGANPAMIAQLGGATMLQIGNGISGNTTDQISGGGGVTYGGLGAVCTASGRCAHRRAPARRMRCGNNKTVQISRQAGTRPAHP